MKTRHLYNTLIILGCFCVYKYSKYLYSGILGGREQWLNINEINRRLIVLLTGIVLAFLANYIINKRVSLIDFGIGMKGFLKGILASFVFCAPMFFILGIANGFNFIVSWELFFKDIFIAGFGEEFIYRAFLFGLLFYFSGWGFLSAGILSGFIFGLGHLYQANDIGSAIFIFLFTTGVSLGFSWFYYVWNSLWMPVFLHGFMDLIWDSFKIEDNVTGSFWVNIARLSAVLLAVIYSLHVAKKNDRLVLKSKLWLINT